MISTKTITPNTNIKSIIKQLSEFDFQNSPDNVELENGQSISGADIRYILEFADKHNYRVIHYLKCSRHPNEIPFDTKFVKFLDLLKANFDL